MIYQWQPNNTIAIQADSAFSQLITDPANVVWLDIEANLQQLTESFDNLPSLHPLTLERLKTKNQRAFFDEYEDYLHILLLQLSYNQDQEVVLTECHFLIGSNYLITAHAMPIEALENYKKSPPPTRFFNQGSDLLFYHLVHPLVHSGFQVLDTIAELSENLEDHIFPQPEAKLLTEIFDLKKDLIAVRKAIAPMREVMAVISRRENAFVDDHALPFFNLLYDELIRLHEMSELQREIVSGALEIYLTTISNRMNEVMKTLTIVSTFILPLTLIVGYYGMNFHYFPELEWRYGMLFQFLLMCLVTGGMYWFFKQKKWF